MSAPNEAPRDQSPEAGPPVPSGERDRSNERAWHEWMMVGVGLTGLLAVLAIVVSVVALASKNPTEATSQPTVAATPMNARGGGMGVAAQPGSSSEASGKPESVSMVMKSDEQHGKKGSDGKWHDAALPANFTVHAGDTVTVTTLNYDDMPHTFTAPSLSTNAIMPGGSDSAPSKTTFTFKAPMKAGKYLWWCSQPCDPWAMMHIGFMRGYVTVAA